MTTSNNHHCHCKESLLVTRKWEDIAALLCEQLITLMKYCNACQVKEITIIKNSTMHDYILTRLDNIERCYSSLYLGGKLDIKGFEYFEGIQDLMLNTLEKTIPNEYNDNEFGVWGSFKLFDWYIQSFLKSDFFKENDIRIE
jgi:hypothetical protein